MLSGKNFRRRHKRALITASDSGMNKRGGNHCFARADIALQKPVHHKAAVHLRETFTDGSALSVGRVIGESAIKIFAEIFYYNIALGFLYAFEAHESELQDEKLFKNEPPF